MDKVMHFSCESLSVCAMELHNPAKHYGIPYQWESMNTATPSVFQSQDIPEHTYMVNQSLFFVVTADQAHHVSLSKHLCVVKDSGRTHDQHARQTFPFSLVLGQEHELLFTLWTQFHFQQLKTVNTMGLLALASWNAFESYYCCWGLCILRNWCFPDISATLMPSIPSAITA